MKLSLTASPSTHYSMTHFQSSFEITGERRESCKLGSLLAAFCLHSMKVLYCLDTVLHRQTSRPVSLGRRKSKNATTVYSFDRRALTHYQSGFAIIQERQFVKRQFPHYEMRFISVNPKTFWPVPLMWPQKYKKNDKAVPYFCSQLIKNVKEKKKNHLSKINIFIDTQKNQQTFLNNVYTVN